MTSPAFTTREDIANRALQRVGASRIDSLDDNDKGAAEVKQCYDGLRRAELRRNVWTFSVKKAVLYPINTPLTGAPLGDTLQSTLKLVPAAWSATKSYPFGWIVAHDGGTWVCLVDESVNDTPGVSGGVAWTTFYGSMCVNPWVDPTDVDSIGGGYYAGDLVYIGSQVFVSLEMGNTTDPMTPSAWDATAYYNEGTVVADAQGFMWKSAINNSLNLQPGVYGFWSSAPTYALDALVIGSDNVLYQALVANTNHNPASGASPTQWEALGTPGSWPGWLTTRTYALGEIVMGSDGLLYQCVQAGNINHNPTTSTYNPNTPSTNWWVATGARAAWYANFDGGACNSAWLGIDAELNPLSINYPIGTGPSVQTQNKNIFMLPNGHLRRAPQDPKAGSVSSLGAPTGRMYEDWEYNGNYIVSASPYPIIYRFGADVVQVNEMDDMFCEALAARIGEEVCETLTQSAQKVSVCMAAYKKFVDEARTVNGIEQGSTEPPEDDYITCRI